MTLIPLRSDEAGATVMAPGSWRLIAAFVLTVVVGCVVR